MDAGSHQHRRGQRIGGKYELIRPVDAGGMGVVWAARHVALDVQVAVKLLRGGPAPPTARARMLDEARVAARLHHRAIVHVHDLGETEEGDPYIVMELLEGRTLADVGEMAPLRSAAWTVQALLPVAEALALLHENGIVHRDVKPANIFLAADSEGRTQPKLIDFGVARFERAMRQRLTGKGLVLGSPDYMSPEQARGAAVDDRTDVWSLAVVLYELLAGTRPFLGAGPYDLFEAIRTQEPDMAPSGCAGDRALWDIVSAGMRKDRAERPNMRAFGRLLAGWLMDHGVGEDVSGVAIASSWLPSPPPVPASAPDADRPAAVRSTVEAPAEAPVVAPVVVIAASQATLPGIQPPGATPAGPAATPVALTTRASARAVRRRGGLHLLAAAAAIACTAWIATTRRHAAPAAAAAPSGIAHAAARWDLGGAPPASAGTAGTAPAAEPIAPADDAPRSSGRPE